MIAYSGEKYVGWQIQPEGISIQGTLEECLSRLFNEGPRVIGAGRTDSGVHALGQVAHFDAPPRYSCSDLSHRLNALLPKEIRILETSEASEDFHAQRSALSKIYHYHLWLDEIEDPFLQPYRFRPRYSLSLEKMKEASRYLIGKRDFTSFTNLGSSAKSHVRTLIRIDFVEQPGGVRLEFEGDGFLYKMVRNLVGMLLEVGKGRYMPSSAAELLARADRRCAPPPAPAHALFLVKVNYP